MKSAAKQKGNRHAVEESHRRHLRSGGRAHRADDRASAIGGGSNVSDRDTAIFRFTPERVPKIEQPQMDEEEKARAALEKQMPLRAIVGPVAPKGFGAAKFNLGSLFTGDMDFGRLDGLVFESDKGRTPR